MTELESDPVFTVLDGAAELRDAADRFLAERLQSLPQGGAEVTCRAGCHACCRQLVVVSPLEAQAIRAYVAERPELEAAVRERVREWIAAVAARPELEAALERFDAAEGYLPGDEGGALEGDYWRAQLDCPFLEDGLCSIYPVRPFGCREHFVLSDPALCAQDPDAPTHAGTRMEYRAVGNWVGTAAFSLPDRLVLLPRVLEYAAAHPEQAEPLAADWEVLDAIAEGQRRTRLALALIMYKSKQQRKADP